MILNYDRFDVVCSVYFISIFGIFSVLIVRNKIPDWICRDKATQKKAACDCFLPKERPIF